MNVSELLGQLFEKSPLQEKKLKKVFAENPQMHNGLKYFFEEYSEAMIRSQIKPEQLIDSYLLMNQQMMHARFHFVRTGKYPTVDEEHARQEVYKNPEVMRPYMLGLGLSQFLWPQHFQVFQFFLDSAKYFSDSSDILEVGCGHGLFLIELIKRLDGPGRIDVIDISATSIEVSKEFLQPTLEKNKQVTVCFRQEDLLKCTLNKTYDFISMGEVLEHIVDVEAALDQLRRLLRPEGRLFLSTCANCPAIDHVSHFCCIEEIRKKITNAGFEVLEEITAPSENLPMSQLKELKIDISYAAILQVKN